MVSACRHRRDPRAPRVVVVTVKGNNRASLVWLVAPAHLVWGDHHV